VLPTRIEIDSLSVPEIRDLIAMMEDVVKKCPQVEIPLKHYFSKDVYAREISLPAGSVIVGAIHKHQNLNILSQGEVTVLSMEGRHTMKAPHTLVAPPGVKRVIVAHTDAVWTTIHGTALTDLEKIEDEFIVKSYAELTEGV